MTAAVNPPKLLKARQLHSRIFAVLLIALLLVSTPQIAADSLTRFFMTWVGYTLVVLGTFGRMVCTAYIGGRKNDVVVSDGPFSIVRNPLYVCSLVAVTGAALQSGMVSMLVILYAVFWTYYPNVVRREEAFLLHRFADDYDSYKQRVPRWLPNVSLWQDPPTIQLQPKFMRNAMKDSWVFFMPMPILALINLLHEKQILPVWLTLP